MNTTHVTILHTHFGRFVIMSTLTQSDTNTVISTDRHLKLYTLLSYFFIFKFHLLHFELCFFTFMLDCKKLFQLIPQVIINLFSLDKISKLYTDIFKYSVFDMK